MRKAHDANYQIKMQKLLLRHFLDSVYTCTASLQLSDNLLASS